MMQEGFRNREFRLGGVALSLTSRRSRDYRALYSRVNQTGYRMATDLNALSELLSPQYQSRINGIMELLQEHQYPRFPESYDAVVIFARQALAQCDTFLDGLDEREGLTDD